MHRPDAPFSQGVPRHKKGHIPAEIAPRYRCLQITHYPRGPQAHLADRWVWKLAKTLIVGQKWVNVDAYRISGDDQIDASINMISDLHIKISESRHFITPGIKPEYRKLIGMHHIRTQ